MGVGLALMHTLNSEPLDSTAVVAEGGQRGEKSLAAREKEASGAAAAVNPYFRPRGERKDDPPTPVPHFFLPKNERNAM